MYVCGLNLGPNVRLCLHVLVYDQSDEKKCISNFLVSLNLKTLQANVHVAFLGPLVAFNY